ncbi:ABC transporter ATP-binding protein [Desulfocurvibacter africanus]|uniref:ABC transporter ATP-binding protein n=1 Tax=Desulfocurvibacter africanus TaxID=873 RepID=UPI00040F6434|nr:ATP-binding cassette domain-containing protein [Desulfocurvibacter africanus]
MPDTPLYQLREVGKEVAGPAERLVILRRIDLSVKEGESVAILGASGSGKTTLLHLLSTLDTPSWGEITMRGRNLAALSGEARARLRNREIGLIFQFHHLLPEFNTLENVAMPGIIGGMPRPKAFDLAREALVHVGLSERTNHLVTTLSGGERQRAAIARAILMKPQVLLGDEPSGSLDEANGEKIAELLLRLNRELGMTLVVVTHNQGLAQRMDRRLELHAGELHAQA